MKVFKFLLSFLITLALTIALSIRISDVPPLGNFLDPFHGFWQDAENEDDDIPESISLKGLQGAVTIKYDSLLIPHIFAENEEDLYMAQGYVTAANRLWQMEFVTHVAAGRLSEIVGERALSFDRLQRRKGLGSSAEETLKLWEKDSVSDMLVKAYARGVNAYIQTLDYAAVPVEYKLLDYEPEPWTPLKSALLLEYMASDLTYHDADLENTNTVKLIGKKRFDFLFPVRTPGDDPVIPKGTKWDFKPIQVDTFHLDLSKAQLAPGEKKLQSNPDNGSNNWAVSGAKTKSGNPILANDPHLGLSLPSIWYVVQLHGPHVNVLGATFPGAPNVIIGFNDSIAWGVTNAPRDVVDWYKIDFTNNERSEYLFNDIKLKTQKRIEKIKVRGGEVFDDTVVYTHHGPVVYDQHFPADTVENNYRGYALKWIAHEPSLGALTFYQLNHAHNYEDYKAALKNWVCPAQNFAFASASGNIAMWVQGKYPVKWKGQGEFMMDGSIPQEEWQGYIPFEQNAHVLNPERGFVSSANQIPVDSTYPYFVYDDHYEHFRNRRINDRLSQMRNITPKDMMNLQNDNYDLKASDILPLMLDTLDLAQFTASQQSAYEMLRKWDYNSNAQLAAPAYFDLWWDKLKDLMWDEFNKGDVQLRVPDDVTMINMMKQHPDDPYMDSQKTTAVETMSDLIRQSFAETVSELDAWQENHEEKLTWSNYKSTGIRHLLRIDAFSRPNIQIGGGAGMINATTSNHGPSWRMVVSLGKPVRAWGVYPGGQSGNPGSPFYDNMITKWSKGQYYEMLFLQSENEKPGKIILTQRMYPDENTD